MSEFDNILPDDFENLEKYAPTLAKLDKRNGFVVPEGYFDALPDHLRALVMIGDAARDKFLGLTLPDKYFEELPGWIETMALLADASKDKTAGFTEPGANYFDALTDQLERLSVLSALLKKGEPFELPEGYFEEFTGELSTRLALDNLKQEQQELFDVPDGYFEQLAGKVQARIALDRMKEGNDADVPAGYFDNFAARLQQRIREEEKKEAAADNGSTQEPQTGKVISLRMHIRRNARVYAAAASVALVLAIGSVLYNTYGTDKGTTPGIVKNDHTNKQPGTVVPAPKDTNVTPNTNNVADKNKVQSNPDKGTVVTPDTTNKTPEHNIANNTPPDKKDTTNSNPQYANNVPAEMPDRFDDELRDAAVDYLVKNEEDLGNLLDELGTK